MEVKAIKTSLKITYPIVLIAVLLALPARGYAQPQSQTAVVEEWIAARIANDTQRAVASLADDSYLIFEDYPSTGITVYTGKAEILQVLEDYRKDNIRIRVTETPNLINGTVAWAEMQSADSLLQADIKELEFFGQAIVEGNEIKSVIYSLTPESRNILVTAGYLFPETLEPGMPRSGLPAKPSYEWLWAFGTFCTLTGGLAWRLGHRS